MSIDTCDECGNPVDTDWDLECYDDGDCCCETCRDILVARQEEDKRLDDPRRHQ